jgi:quercetin dioxygenase-like cupin family protein
MASCALPFAPTQRTSAIIGARRRTWLVRSIAVAAIAVCAPVSAQESTEQMKVVNPQKAKFITIPDMPSCATAAILRGNPRSGPAWVLLKLASGCQVPWHWHTANEDMLVINGQGTIDMQDGPPLQFVPGAYAALPSHHTHHATCTRACLLFSIADAAFDIHYVDANGQEISARQALKPLKRGKGKKQ